MTYKRNKIFLIYYSILQNLLHIVAFFTRGRVGVPVFLQVISFHCFCFSLLHILRLLPVMEISHEEKS